MSFQPNLDIFFDTDYSGEEASVNGIDLVGIFDNEYVETVIGNVPVQGVKPILRVKDSDIGTVDRGDPVILKTLNGQSVTINYRVIKPEQDGTGVTDLILEKV